MQLKKLIQKDRYGNMMHIEFEPDSNVPPMQQIPMYDHPGDPKGTDTVPAWLTPGEFVVNKEATDIYGPIIEKMNDHGRKIQETMPQYADEGMKVFPGIPMKKPDMYQLFTDQGVLPSAFKPEMVSFDNIDKYDSLINDAASRYNLSPSFLKAVLYTESGGKSDAVGDKRLKNKAFGLGQVRKNAYKDIKKDFPDYQFSLDQVQTNPVANIDASAKYLSMIENKYLPGANKGLKGFEKGSIDKMDQNQKENLMYQFYNAGPYSKSTAAVRNANKVMAVKNMLSGTSFPGEEKYQTPVEPKKGMSFLDKLLNIKLAEGGEIPEPSYLAHGGVHILDPSTWNKKHFNMQGNEVNMVPDYIKNPNMEYIPPADQTIPKFENITKEDKSPLGKLYTEENEIPELDGIAKPPEKKKIEVPELDGIAPKPDYTGEDRTTMEKIFPKLYKSRPQFGGTNERGAPNKRQQAEQAFANDPETKDTFFNEIIINPFDGAPQSVNQNRISEEKKNKIEELYAESGNKKRYDDQIAEYNKAVAQDKARKAWEAKQERIKNEQTTAENEKKIQDLENKKIPGNNSVNEKIDNKINEIKNQTKKEDDKKVDLTTEQNQKLMDIWTKTAGSKTPDDNSKDDAKVTKQKVIEVGTKATNKQKSDVTSALKSFFGDLFDTKELKRAAIVYLGSRLMGNSHNGSLRYIAKSYLTRVDTKSAARSKWIRENATKYTPASLKLYEQEGDWSVLVPKGQIPRSTADRKFFYDAMGRKRQALKYDITTPDGKTISYYSYDGGKSRVPQGHHDDPKIVVGSDAFNKETRAQAGTVSKIIKEQMTRIDETIKKTDTLGSKKKTYITNIAPEGDAYNVALWARKNGYDMEQLGGQISLAYEMAIADSQNRNIKARTLVPYLEQLEIRNESGVMGILTEKIGDKTYTLNNDKFKVMNQEVLDFFIPGVKDVNQQKVVLQNFYGQLNKTFLEDPDRAKYIQNTPEGYTPFGYYLQQAIEVNKIRLAQQKGSK